MKVLVTGGAGRLGRSVVAGLTGVGHDVVSVDIGTVGHAGITEVTADLLDADDTRELVAEVAPDAVIHLAGIAVPFSAPEQDILVTNTALAANVAEAAVGAEVEVVVNASSPTPVGYGNPAGWQPAYLPIDENHPLEPWHAYGVSKVVIEQVTRAHARTERTRPRFFAFRPCYVIAPEEWDGAPTQAGHTVAERLDDPALGAVSLFNYVDARDVTSFLAALLERASDIPNGEVFFVGAEDALAREPLAELLPRFHPGTQGHAASLTGAAPAFTSDRARRLLGWRPSHSWRTELGENPRSLEQP